MTSILTTIYSALDGMTVAYTDKNGATATATCYGLGELPGSVQTASLPCRLLLPIGQGQGGSPNMVIEPGGNIQAQWNITDLFLIETEARGEGLYIQAPILMNYIAAYAEAIGKKWQWLSTQHTEVFTTSISTTPGVYEYPAGSGVSFYGVMVNIQISEIF